MGPNNRPAIIISSFVLLLGWFGYDVITRRNATTDISRRLRDDPLALVPKFPKEFSLEPVLDVPLPRSACFLACIRADLTNDDLTCFFREHYVKVIIGKIILDGKTFHIKSPLVRDAIMDSARHKDFYSSTVKSLTPNVIFGEDPRSFVFEGDVYVMNNFAKENTLIKVGDQGAKAEADLPRELLGKKNITPVPIPGVGILFIDFQEQNINVCVRIADTELELNCEPFWKEVEWIYKEREGVNKDDWHHRGGTAGVQISHGVYVGFGHTTHVEQHTIGPHHDIWFWKFDMRQEKAYVFMDHVPIDHRLDHKITDPTSLVYVGDDWYLFTAESDEFWRSDNVMIVNRMYRVKAVEGTMRF